MFKVKFLLANETDMSKAVFLNNSFETVVDFAVWTVESGLVLVEKHWEDTAENKYFLEEKDIVKVESVGRTAYKENPNLFLEYLTSFCNGVLAIREASHKRNGFTHEKNIDVIYEEGSRYFKILYRTQWSGGGEIRQAIHCFVDKNNGDILKAATWRAPAKHARGNIFNDNCLKCVNEYGAAYLR